MKSKSPKAQVTKPESLVDEGMAWLTEQFKNPKVLAQAIKARNERFLKRARAQ